MDHDKRDYDKAILFMENQIAEIEQISNQKTCTIVKEGAEALLPMYQDILDSLEIARKLQEGYTLVPNEPTEEMIKRGCDKFLSFGRGSNGICNAYRTMIIAAQETRKG